MQGVTIGEMGKDASWLVPPKPKAGLSTVKDSGLYNRV